MIDCHNLPKPRGQLCTNPYIVLTMNGVPFARSTTSRGTANPVWSTEVFMVKLSPPPPGTWPLTVQDYFHGYRCDRTSLRFSRWRCRNKIPLVACFLERWCLNVLCPAVQRPTFLGNYLDLERGYFCSSKRDIIVNRFRANFLIARGNLSTVDRESL